MTKTIGPTYKSGRMSENQNWIPTQLQEQLPQKAKNGKEIFI